MQKSFDAYNDPGHGWVKVPKSLLKELGIEDKITDCSFMRKEYAYLEEDCDATTLVKALEARGIVPKWRDHTSNKESKIKSYEPYRSPNKPGSSGFVCVKCGDDSKPYDVTKPAMEQLWMYSNKDESKGIREDGLLCPKCQKEVVAKEREECSCKETLPTDDEIAAAIGIDHRKVTENDLLEDLAKEGRVPDAENCPRRKEHNSSESCYTCGYIMTDKEEFDRNLANHALEMMTKGPGIVEEATENSRPWP